jgi:hypothetical protein
MAIGGDGESSEKRVRRRGILRRKYCVPKYWEEIWISSRKMCPSRLGHSFRIADYAEA